MNPGATTTPAIRVWLQALVLVAAGCWIYWPVVHGAWLWDDVDEIVRSRVLRDPAGWWKIWASPSDVDYFPLKSTLQWALWQGWGARPAVYHLVNLALHLASGFLFWRLLARLGVRLAWLGALLFVVHPLAVESVAWISELKNTLSLPFLLLAMLAYVEYSDRTGGAGETQGRDGRTARPSSNPDAGGAGRHYLLSLFFFFLAMLSKSSAVMFPVVILLYGWSKRGRVGRGDVVDSIPFFGIAAALGVVTLWFQHNRAMGLWTMPAGGLGSRLLSAGLAIAFYLEKSVVPAGLLPIYPQWRLDPSSLWQWLPLPAAAALLCWFWTRRSGWGTPALLGFGFFLLNLLPVLGFIPMAYLHIAWVADHFAYVPLLGIIGLGVAAGGKLAGRSNPVLRPIAVAVAVLVVGAFAWESRGHARWFQSEETLWTEALRRDPTVWMAHKNLGYAYSGEGRDADAVREYETALRLKPDFPEALNNLGILLAAQGRSSEAMARYRDALRWSPDYVSAHNNLGVALARTGDLAGAAAEYARVLRLQPDFAEARNNFGKTLAELGQLPEAIGQFEAALRLDPDNAEAHNNLGNALAHSNRLPEAVAQFKAALRLKPDLAAVHSNLGTALFQLGRLEEARGQFVEALRLKADDAEVHNNFGVVLGRIGDVEAATSQYAEALRLRPGYAEAHTNLANLLYRRGDARGAAVHYAEALRLQPGSADAHNRLGVALAALGRLADAREQFSEALRLSPDDAEARGNLEHAERDIGKPGPNSP
jgi:protein O-mannosyl-transferase